MVAAYVGNENNARKIRQVFVGVDGVAKRVAKAYVGVDGTARLWWSGSDIQAPMVTLTHNRSGTIYTGSTATFTVSTTDSQSVVSRWITVNGTRYEVDTNGAYTHVFPQAAQTCVFVGFAENSTGNIGESAPLSIWCARDSVAPTVTLTCSVNDSTILPGTVIQFAVTARDNVGVTSRWVSINGTRYPLNASGVYTHTFRDSGRYSVAGLASDASNNLGASTTRYFTVPERGLTASMHPATNRAVASLGNYAFFAGGRHNKFHDNVTVYNTDLIQLIATPLSQGRTELTGVGIGNHVLFGGGTRENPNITGSGLSVTVDAYDRNLTKTSPASLSEARRLLAATSAGSYALFGGGWKKAPAYSATVDYYTPKLVHGVAPSLLSGRYNLAAASVGTYAIFAGGSGNNKETDEADAYNNNLTKCFISRLFDKAQYISGLSFGSFALFGGGLKDITAGTRSSEVTAYNQSLTRSNPTKIGARDSMGSAVVGDFALFIAGFTGTIASTRVESYNRNLTKAILPASSIYGYAYGNSVGNYAVIASNLGPVEAYNKQLVRTNA